MISAQSEDNPADPVPPEVNSHNLFWKRGTFSL